MTVVLPAFRDQDAASGKISYKINQELICMTKIRTFLDSGRKIVIQI